MLKKISALILTLVFLMSTLSVYADSGASAIPKDNTWKQYCYKYVAPKTQTSFKTWHTQDRSVSSLKKEHGEIRANISTCMSICGITSLTFPQAAIIADVTSAGLYMVYLVDDKVIVKNLNTLKKNTKIHSDIKFRWTNAARLRYEIKITYYAKYNGKKIKGTTKTRTIKGTFAG